MAEQKLYPAQGISLSHFGQTLERWFQSQQLETQLLDGGVAGVTVQARMKKDWRFYVGASTALSVTVTPSGDNILVQIGAAKWADKVVGGVAAAIVFWPLAALPAWGAYKQKQLFDDAFQFIDRYMASGGQVTLPPTRGAAFAPQPAPVSKAPAPTTAPAMTGALCPACGKPTREGANFCDNCGARLQSSCGQCGATLRPGAKFCDSCGAKVA